MSVIVFLSNRVAKAIHGANPEETSSVERLTAILALQCVNYGVIVLSLCIGAAAGEFWSTALSVLTFAVVRLFTGGLHFKSLDICFLASTIVLSSIPHLFVSAWLSTTGALVLIIIFSRKKKLLPIVIIGANFFIESPIIGLAALAQSLTLIERR